MSTRPQVARTLAEIERSFFSFGSPRLLGLQLACALAVRPLLGPLKFGDLLILVGVVAYWPFQEWLGHRVLLHARPLRIGRFVWELPPARAHRIHHERPLEPGPALLPTRSVFLMVPLHLLFWKLIAPTQALACTGIIGFGAAALSYEWVHFMTHTGYRPRTRWFREVKRRHLAHHFQDSERFFAFVVPAVDDWLGTGAPTAAEVVAKRTHRTAH